MGILLATVMLRGCFVKSGLSSQFVFKLEGAEMYLGNELLFL